MPLPWTKANTSSRYHTAVGKFLAVLGDRQHKPLTYTQAKTGEKVTVPLHSDLAAHLETLAGTDTPEVFIMPHMAGLKTGGRHGLSEGFKRIMRNAGLDIGKVKSAGVRQLSRRTFHALRHSFTSALANAGLP